MEECNNKRLGRVYLKLKEKPNNKYLSGQLEGRKYVVYMTKNPNEYLLDIYEIGDKSDKTWHNLNGGFF